ncbi:unnamed protein product [Zymoseptoria tritici ST99CH_3D1]|nr:unnamed protein product [Zymoseptoria tritici ST99CH_3D1]
MASSSSSPSPLLRLPTALRRRILRLANPVPTNPLRLQISREAETESSPPGPWRFLLLSDRLNRPALHQWFKLKLSCRVISEDMKEIMEENGVLRVEFRDETAHMPVKAKVVEGGVLRGFRRVVVDFGNEEKGRWVEMRALLEMEKGVVRRVSVVVDRVPANIGFVHHGKVAREAEVLKRFVGRTLWEKFGGCWWEERLLVGLLEWVDAVREGFAVFGTGEAWISGEGEDYMDDAFVK